jgi:hypothetical protein
MNSKQWIKYFIFIFVSLGLSQFIVISLTTDTLIKKIFEKSPTYSNAKWLLDYNIFPKYVFMGSSMSKNSIIPSILTKNLKLTNKDKIVNIGMNSATPYEMYLSYKKSKSNFNDTKVFFYTLEPWIFQRKYYVYSNFEKLSWTYSEWNYFSKLYSINNNYFNKINLLYGAFTSSKSNISEDFGYKRLECQKFDFFTKEILEERFSDEVNNDYGISEFQLKYLKKLKNEITEDGAEFILVYIPNDYSYYESHVKYNNKYNDLLSNTLTKALGKTKQIGFFNPKKIGLTDDYFADAYHMCHKGAIKFSEYLSTQITTLNEVRENEINLPFKK